MAAQHMRMSMVLVGMIRDLLEQTILPRGEPLCIGLCQWVDYIHAERFGKDTPNVRDLPPGDISLKVRL